MLSSRLVALSKRLTLETKIRDAALSLSRANSSYKTVSKQTSEQLENANRKVDLAQKELWRVSEKVNEINRRLLEHRAGVLSYSVRSLEKKMAPPETNGNGESSGSGRSTPNRTSALSPTQSSAASAHSNSSRSRFDGAHFFAGHSDAIVPSAPKGPASSAEVAALQEQLKAAQAALDASNAQQAKLAKELSSIRSERQMADVSKASELRQAEEMIAALEGQMGKMQGLGDRAGELEDEKRAWAKERVELEQKRLEVDTLERRLEMLEERNSELVEVEEALAMERQAVDEKDREIMELKEERVVLLTERVSLQQGGESKAQLDFAVDAIQELMRQHGVSHYSRDVTVVGLTASIGKHLDDQQSKMDSHARAQEEWNAARSKLEVDLRVGMDRREQLDIQLEEVRHERDMVKSQAKALEKRLKVRFAFQIIGEPTLTLFTSRRTSRKAMVLSSNTKAMPPRLPRNLSLSGTSSLRRRLGRRSWAGVEPPSTHPPQPVPR